MKLNTVQLSVSNINKFCRKRKESLNKETCVLIMVTVFGLSLISPPVFPESIQEEEQIFIYEYNGIEFSGNVKLTQEAENKRLYFNGSVHYKKSNFICSILGIYILVDEINIKKQLIALKRKENGKGINGSITGRYTRKT